MRRRHRAALATAAALCGLLVTAACSSPVTGHGSTVPAAARSGVPSDFPSAADSTSAPAPATTSPLSGACAAGSITASGAPFCYPLPRGFRDASHRSDYGHGWTFRTLVADDRKDLIEVLAAPGPNFDFLSYAQLASFYDHHLRLRSGTFRVRKAGAVRRVQAGGARGFEQQVTYVDGVHGDITFVFRALSLVNIDCQSKDHLRTIRATCARVRATIQIY